MSKQNVIKVIIHRGVKYATCLCNARVYFKDSPWMDELMDKAITSAPPGTSFSVSCEECSTKLIDIEEKRNEETIGKMS